jgi:hypothetical protein
MPTPPTSQETQYVHRSSLDALYDESKVQQPERAETEYDFDPISTQGMEEIAEIERRALADMGNADTTLRSPLQDLAAAIEEDEGNMEDIEPSGEQMEIMIQYMTPPFDNDDLNYHVLSAISLGMVAYVPDHFESRRALWSSNTCFTELGIKPQFEVASDDGVSRIVLLQFYNSENIQKIRLYVSPTF